MATTAILLSSLMVSVPLANALEYLEPNVQRHAGILPRSVCKQLIQLGEEGGKFPAVNDRFVYSYVAARVA